jgi:photosystem II stability/assembly factor-like uncharacterized protein
MSPTQRGRLGVLVVVAMLLVVTVLVAAPCAAANTAAPGGNWFWQNPLPQANQVNDMTFVDANAGWAVGAAGLIVKTTNGGATWTPQGGASQVWFDSVTFADNKTGWACGQSSVTGDAVMMATTDGGAGWTPQALPLAAGNGVELTSVFALDALNLYAVGTAGTILHTIDGGATWVQDPSPTVNSLACVTFASINIGWAVGANGEILRTNNGGLLWFPEASGTGNDLDKVIFTSLYKGYAVGVGGTVRSTVNGGSTWSGIGPGNNDLYDVAAAGASLFLAGAGGELDVSTNGGATWADIGPGGLDIRAMTVLSTTDLRIAGANGMFQRTVDGSTWTPMWWATTSQTLRGITFSDPLNGWAVGAGGTIVHTGSGGANWYRQESGVGQQLNAVATAATAGAPAVWTVGNRPGGAGTAGVIRFSADGGLTWGGQTNPVNQNLNGIFMKDQLGGWAVGNNGTIIVTGNGGGTWTAQTSNAAGIALNGVDFAFDSGTGSSRGAVVGAGGAVRYTADSGTTWSTGVSNTGNDLFAVDMLDIATGWAVGANGTIVKTTDGGATWTAQASNSGAGLYAVHFVDANNGWVAGAGGTLITTADGGATWTVQPWMFDEDTRGVAATDVSHVWLCGQNGDILSSFNPNTLAVTNLKGNPGDTRITVSWTNPASNFGGVMVYFSTLRCASDVNDTYGQSIAYEGTGASLVRTGLQNNTAYYFTVFVRDTAGDWSNPQTLVLVPVPTFKVTLSVKPATQVSGKPIRFYGKVTPAGTAAGKAMQLQRFTGSWKTFATAKVSASGAFSVSKALTRGTFKVRAFMAATPAALAGSSPARYVTWK